MAVVCVDGQDVCAGRQTRTGLTVIDVYRGANSVVLVVAGVS